MKVKNLLSLTGWQTFS